MIKVLFVCLGNICRSPLAEAIFNEQVKKKGLSDRIMGDSAGTSNYHIGEDPDTRSIEVSIKHDVPISHKGRQFHYMDGKQFQYLLAMDQANYRDMIHELGYKHDGLFLICDFDEHDKGADVPDPYYGGKEGFENVFQMLDRSIAAFLDYLIEKHQLSG